MSEKIPNNKSAENIPEEKSMSEAETLLFLKENNIEPLTNWQPGQPLLYVLEEVIRGDDGPYGYLPKEGRPSIARLDSPTSLDFDDRRDTGDNRVVYPLLNETGGRVDFYAIDPETKKVRFMLIPRPMARGKDKPFHVRKETLFKADDVVFPPSK